MAMTTKFTDNIITDWTRYGISPYSYDLIGLLKKLEITERSPSRAYGVYRRVGDSIEIQAVLPANDRPHSIDDLIPLSFTIDKTRPMTQDATGDHESTFVRVIAYLI